jgi:uncharacterized damage-inducible protein DinB
VSYPALDLTAQWGRLNDGLSQLADLVPDEKLDWSPQPDLWNLRGILLHISMARHNWMELNVQDGFQISDGPAASGGEKSYEERVRAFLQHGATKDGLKDHLRWSWQRLERFLSNPHQLNATYRGEGFRDHDHQEHNGHWIAFHLLEHDVHHRADIFHYLALLGIAHPTVETP